MFNFLKKSAKERPEEEANDPQADKILKKIEQLENQLAQNSSASEIHKQLMLEYNRAIKIFAKNKHYHQHIDIIFTKMDELRNIIRKTIRFN